jgi:hypothetical protein
MRSRAGSSCIFSFMYSQVLMCLCGRRYLQKVGRYRRKLSDWLNKRLISGYRVICNCEFFVCNKNEFNLFFFFSFFFLFFIFYFFFF